MTSIFFDNDFIGLEKDDKKRGLVEFKTQDLDALKLEFEEIQPRFKRNDQRIIIRDGRTRTRGKNTELF